jgi:hypothetical protein
MCGSLILGKSTFIISRQRKIRLKVLLNKVDMNNSDPYVDPPNTPELLSRLRSSRTLGEVRALADEIFPNWFVTVMDIYCPDYPHLMRNWKEMCKMTNIKPAQVMIVEELAMDDAHSLIGHLAECFTRAGFSVRRKREYIPCENCGSAVPTELMWKLFKTKKFQVPPVWLPKCTGCYSQAATPVS